MILVSSCLLGLKCRYDGQEKTYPLVEAYLSNKSFLPVCPEQMGGLSTPRRAAEIVSLNPLLIVNDEEDDVTSQFETGVNQVLKLIDGLKITEAILKSRSPSCGSSSIYDGSFTRTLIEGEGILCAALRRKQIKVKSELDLLEGKG